MAEIDINGLLTTDQREELIDAAASTYVAATLGSTDDEIAALQDFRDLALSVLGIEMDDEHREGDDD